MNLLVNNNRGKVRQKNYFCNLQTVSYYELTDTKVSKNITKNHL